MHPKQISILDYTYVLPEQRIASQPLAERDASKLLVYQNSDIKEDQFKNLVGYLPENSLLVFNDTRVIQARLLFQKPTGGVIEIFCLEPYEQTREYTSIMAMKGKLRWKCLIGGAGKWKEGPLQKSFPLQGLDTSLQARLVEKLPDAYVVELSWQPAHFSFAEIIEQAGETPLPPYIKRKAAAEDKKRYQTIYAKQDGSVAAPTAGLHFTPDVFSSLREKNIAVAYVTLHVGAGTFKPVKAALLEGHLMHAEWIDVTLEAIETLISGLQKGIIAVGTTSLRTLESLYWMGVKVIQKPASDQDELIIYQWDVYEPPLVDANIDAADALSALAGYLKKNNAQRLISPTQILLAPGYRFRIARGIITNFHQPQSTLLLLIAAAIGEDWSNVYDYALQHDFRFLSYGDSSLLYFSSRQVG